ncbi:MAG: single-stranded DNA-binding protein, partial [Clostridia bacterium]|nr:single-stranded DNA-binding protein [Clostridia bacterium]
RRRNQQTGEWEDYANFVDCTMFGNRASGVHPYLSKGLKVAIEGKLRYSTWERDGQKRSKLEVVVDDIEFMTSRGGQQGGNAGGYGGGYNAPQANAGGYGYNAPQANAGGYGYNAPQNNAGGYGYNAPQNNAGGYGYNAPQATAPQMGAANPAPSEGSAPAAAPTIDPTSSVYDDDIPF